MASQPVGVPSKHTLLSEPVTFSTRKCKQMQSLHPVKWPGACTVNSREKGARPVSEFYRIHEPTIAMFQEGGVYVARTVASGAVIEVCNGPIDGDRLVDVIWDGRNVMMFT